MSRTCPDHFRVLLPLVVCASMAIAARADQNDFTVLYRFQAATPNTFTSPLGSQPDS